MTPGNLFQLQLAEATVDRRRLLLRAGVGVLLALPFILVSMPPRAKAGGLVMVIVFTGFFGTAVGHVRLREGRFLERLSMLPVSRASLTLDLLLASIVSRGVQAGIILVAFIIVNGSIIRLDALVLIAGLLCATLLLLTLLGIGVARIARNNAEVHLFGALTVGFLAAVSGAIPAPGRLASLTETVSWSPINRLVATLTGLSTRSLEISRGDTVAAAAVLGVVVASVILRTVQGSKFSREAFDSSSEIVDNRPSIPIKEERR